jgi:hypothetical protein
MVKRLFALILIFIIWFILVFGANASGFDKAEQYVRGVIEKIIRFAFSVLMVLASILLIYLGILYIVFGKTEIKVIDQSIDLRKSLLFLVIGLVVVILAFFLPNIIKDFIESSIR